MLVTQDMPLIFFSIIKVGVPKTAITTGIYINKHIYRYTFSICVIINLVSNMGHLHEYKQQII